MKLLIVVRYLIRGVIFLISIWIMYSLLYPVVIATKNQNNILSKDNDLSKPIVGLRITEIQNTISQTSDEIPIKESEAIRPSSNEQAIINRFNIPVLAITLDYIYAPSTSPTNNYKLCIEEIGISGGLEGVEDYGLFNSHQILLEDYSKQSCFESGINYIVINTTAFRPMILRNRNFDTYLYPFDDRILGFEVSFKGYIEKPNGQKESIDQIGVEINLSHSRWDKTIESQDIQTDNLAVKKLLVTLKRLWIYRVLFFIIPLIALTALISLIAVDNLGSFWEVSIAMLGLWSVHQILIPDYIVSPTIIDQILALLYILLFFIVLATLAAKFREKGVIDVALLIPIRKGMTNLVKWGENQIDEGWVSNEEIAKAFLVRSDLVNSTSTKEKLRTVAEIFINRSDTE